MIDIKEHTFQLAHASVSFISKIIQDDDDGDKTYLDSEHRNLRTGHYREHCG